MIGRGHQPGVFGRSIARSCGFALALSFGLWFFLSRVHRHYPISQWMFWPYLGYWAIGAVFALSVTAAGDRVVRSVVGHRLPDGEHFAIAFALGLLAFATTVFAFGIVGAFGRAFFFVLPALLFASGGTSFAQYLAESFRRVRTGRSPARAFGAITLSLGVLAAILAYAPVIVPNNVAYDSRWYHIPIAEHYVAARRIERFPEGWTLGAYPQLVTLVYTWAAHLPLGLPIDRVLLCAHVEWVTFLATLAMIPAMVRRLVPGLSGWRSWLFVFLFPGLFLYDSNLNAGADHFQAALAPAVWLSLLRVWPTLDLRSCMLFGLATAAAMLAKYTSLAIVGPAFVAFGVRVLWLSAARLAARGAVSLGRVVLGSAVVGSACLVATAIHWLKNVIFYRDPLFPILHEMIRPNPWGPEADIHYQKFMMVIGTHRPPQTREGMLETLKVAANFSFVPNNWPTMHGEVPVFGSLFTLSLLALPFCGKRWRLWGIALATELGVMIWYWTNHQDRYLQALVPWMAAMTAGVMTLAFRSGIPGKVAATALVGAQAIWGGDVPFIPTHAMIGDTPIREAARLIGLGFLHRPDERRQGPDFAPVGAVLPPQAKVLVHNSHIHIGLEAKSVNDWAPFQSGLVYRRLESPRGVYDKLTSFGVTHLLWPSPPMLGLELDSVGSNLAFWEFAEMYAEKHRPIGGVVLASMPRYRPEPTPNRLVTYLGCNDVGRYPSGLYRLTDMDQLYDLPFKQPLEWENGGDEAHTRSLVGRARFLVIEDCRPSANPMAEGFRSIYKRSESTLYARVLPKPE